MSKVSARCDTASGGWFIAAPVASVSGSRNAPAPPSLAILVILLGAVSSSAAVAPLDCGSVAAAENTLTPCLTFASGGSPMAACCDPLRAWESAG